MNTPRQSKRPATVAELQLATELFAKRAHTDVSLAPFTTYRVGGNAALHVHAESIDDLEAISTVLAQVDLPLLVIGRGSNILIADTGFQGLAITFGSFLEYIDLPDRSDDEDNGLAVEPIALFGGSVPLPVAARQSVHRGLTGFEWGVGVPGTIGGAVRMNAGGHGSDMASSLVSARIFHLLRGVEAHVDAVDLGLRFRGSAIADHHVVLSATLNLGWATDTQAAENQLSEIVKWRRENQPGGQNAGSVFVNPVPGEVSAGALIDQIGMRGFRIGTAHVSEKHANFIQSEDGGLASDVVQVMAEIRRRVKDSTGYDLRSEIRLAGFDAAIDPALMDVLTSESDTSVATVRLEHIFERNSNTSVVADTSIPISILSSSDFQDPLDVPAEVLDELSAVFSDETSTTQEQPVIASVTDIKTREVTMPVVSAEIPVSAPVTAPGRVVIVDEDFRQPSESDFPSDTDSQSVHKAPTSVRVLITDDDVAQDLDAQIIVGTQWSDGTRSRRLLGMLTNKIAGGNKRKRLVMTGLGLVLFVGVALIVLASPLVAVRTVQVEGAKYADAALVRSVSDSLKGKSVLTVDTKTASERLESDPWIKSARITTSLPSRVLIQINERIPVAWFLGVDNRARVIDEDGLVLSVVEGRPTQYMWIDGTGPNLTAGASSTATYRAAGQLAMSLPSELAPMVEHLGVAGSEQITMTLKTGTVINFGAPVDMRNKLVNVVVLLRRQDVNSIISIDVSTGTPVVQS
ncbi:MAG: UDP-N-acetylenolpyruvoylglucosamine reductase [Actinomycetota bacterium]|jgi:UDP-N-acetylmuramate dehydrogenase